MYEELVEDLRSKAEFLNVSDIRRNAHGPNLKNSFAEAMLKAADAIEELSKLVNAMPYRCECCVGCELEQKNGGCDSGFILSPKRAMEYIEELGKPHWISVEERLPEVGERVLVSNGGFVCESFLSQRGKWRRGGVDMFFVTPTHWMPLPEPPKEEQT